MLGSLVLRAPGLYQERRWHPTCPASAPSPRRSPASPSGSAGRPASGRRSAPCSGGPPPRKITQRTRRRVTSRAPALPRACSRVRTGDCRNPIAPLRLRPSRARYRAAPRAAGTDDFRGRMSALTDVRTGKADANEQKRHLTARRAVPQVGRHREDCLGAGAYAVDRCDDGLRASPHRLDEISGHLRELPEAGLVSVTSHFHERPDDLVHVAAGRKILARAREHDHFQRGFRCQPAKQIAQLRVRFECKRVFPLRSIERDRRDPSVDLPEKMLGLDGAHLRAGRFLLFCFGQECATAFPQSR